MVYLNKVVGDAQGKIAAKLEIMEPCCSVKDRCAPAGVGSVAQRDAIRRRCRVQRVPVLGGTSNRLDGLRPCTFHTCRIGYAMITDAEQAGKISPGKVRVPLATCRCTRPSTPARLGPP